MLSHFHLSPVKEGKGLADGLSLVPEYSTMIYDCQAWEPSEAAKHEKSEKSSKSRERKEGLGSSLGFCSSQTLKHYSEGCHKYASHRPLQTKRVILSRLFPHIAGGRGLICNHQRNADRLETGLHSIILIRIKDLFWRSFLGFFLAAPPTPNEVICIHGPSEADMKSDSLQTYISDSVA